MNKRVIMIGAALLFWPIIILSCWSLAEPEKQTNERSLAAARDLKAKVEEKFQSLTPEEHLQEASSLMKIGELDIARRHIDALPPGHSGKAAKERELAAKERAVTAAKEKARKEDAGPCPNRTVMSIALRSVLARAVHDPASLEDPEVGTPIKVSLQTKAGKVYCWKVPFSFRARNGFGAMRVTNGLIWMKDGASIKTMLEQ